MANSEALSVKPIAVSSSLRTLAYEALKTAITGMDIYGRPDEVRLDERKLSQAGTRRQPHPGAGGADRIGAGGFRPLRGRRGIFVIRKTKRQIVGMNPRLGGRWRAWRARLACEGRATPVEDLKDGFPEFFGGQPATQIDEFGRNIRFHQTIIRLGHCEAITELTGNLFMHVRGIRNAALRQGGPGRALDPGARRHHRGASGTGCRER